MAQDTIAVSNKILRKLKQSVRDGDLKAFPSGSNISYELEMNEDVMTGGLGLAWVDKLYDERLKEFR